MQIRRAALALAVIAVVVLAPTIVGQTPASSPDGWRDLLSKPEHEVRALIDVPVTMRDGVRLSADVYLPRAAGRWPVILARTPYGNQNPGAEATYFASRGYAYVVQDTRGRHDSDGKWYAWVDEINDGRDSVDWAGTQPWSNGNVGMTGGSYGGLVQWHAAATGSPYLKTIVPRMAPADYFIYGMNYRGGAFKLRGNLPWAVGTSSRTSQNATTGFDWHVLLKHVPILTADEAATGRVIDFYRDWIRHSNYDDYWRKISNYGQFEKMNLPILQIGGWFDVHVVSTIANYEGIQRFGTPLARQAQKVIMGPWVHTGSPQPAYGDLDFGPESVLDLRVVQLRWFDRWLKNIVNGADREPPLKLFTLGENKWRSVERWPLPQTRWTSLYLDSDGRANSMFGNGRLSFSKPAGKAASDSYSYNPRDPVPTLVDQPWDDRPIDYRPIERRDDVLVYSSEPLSEDMDVTGPVQATLFASSSARDTDWTVRLLDVYPDGRAIALCDGILRARFREPSAVRTGVPAPGQFAKPQLLQPGAVNEFTIEVGVVSNLFRKGHRIRIEVSSSNFPRFDRNLNNGGELGVDPTIVVANQTIYHDDRRLSAIQLPVIPRPDGTR